MPPSLKDLTVANTPETAPAARSSLAQRAEDPSRPQPVPLEVPVTVHGARTAEGSTKREPFSETTRTVLIFANGAVIRLSSSVTAGQLLFLTNESTKKEIVCQVVKSKNYKNVSGYVELEFTEPMVGFWGMRFPGDKLGPQSVAPAASAPPVAPVRAAAPAASGPTETSPPAGMRRASDKINAPASQTPVSAPRLSTPIASGDVPALNLPHASEAKPTYPASPLPKVGLSPSTQPATETAPGAPVPRVPSTDSTGLFRSVMNFVESGAANPPVQPNSSLARNAPIKTDPASLASQFSALLADKRPLAPAKPTVPQTQGSATKPEAASSSPDLWPAKSPATAPRESRSVASLLEDEGIPVPSWFDPAGRKNAPAKVYTPPAPVVSQPEPVHVAEEIHAPAVQDIEEHPIPATQASFEHHDASSIESPDFGSRLLSDDPALAAIGAKNSRRGLVIGAVAALTLLAAGGGWWFFRRSSSTNHAGPVASAPASLVSNSPSALISSTSEPVFAAANSSSSNPTASNSNSAVKPAGSSAAGNAAPSKNPNTAANSAAEKTAPMQPARADGKTQPNLAVEATADKPAPKRPAIPQIHLAAPVSRKASSVASAEASMDLAGEMAAPPVSSDSSALLAAHSNRPSAPRDVSVGGSVSPAKLLTSAPPLYPQSARSLRVSGDVIIDALIDTSGHVTQMKVISGQPLLHQAAMDAVKQWRYRPAMLDGKPTPVHITVMVKFRLQ